ncbi:MAG: cob(I)yrinic acid a,c-diamide adenosyltransferase [Porticoccaceae bacterium]
MTRLYTRSGDRGDTGLADGSRRRKDDARIQALGSLDECNAQLGLLLAHLTPDDPLLPLLAPVQHRLFDLGAMLAGAPATLEASDIDALERHIDALCAALPPLRQFVLPGGSPPAALAHVARAVCRRAERDLVAAATAEALPPEPGRYLNRLSDLLFAVARTLAARAGGDLKWEPRDRC